MTSTPDTILAGVELQGLGDNTNTWGFSRLNNGLVVEAKASHGYISIAITGDTTLVDVNYSTANSSENRTIEFTGSISSTASITFPSRKRRISVKNSATASIVVKCSGGTGVTIPASRAMDVYSDGVDFYNGVATYLGTFSPANSQDPATVLYVETAIANASLPATAGTVLVSGSDTTAGFVGTKISVTGSGAATVTPSTTNPGANETKVFAVSVGDGGLADGGLQLASFAAAVGNAYTLPTGGTVTLPTPTGTRRKIELAMFGAGSTTLSGLINGAATFIVDGNQTLTITDASAITGWV